MSNSPIVRDVLDNGLRLLTEKMTQVRSISIGVWLTRGSRHETAERGGIAHFVEHMLFKGTTTRTAEDIAQAIDSIGGQLDAFTAKEYASYYIKVLDEHLPLAIDILSDIVLNPAFGPDDIEREKKVVLEEIKMVEDTPDDLVHELFTQGFWENHPLGRPILGRPETVESFDADLLRRYFRNAYTAHNLIISAVGNLEHERVRELVEAKFGAVPTSGETVGEEAPTVVPKILIRNKELEQSHVCLGASSYPQNHDDRYAELRVEYPARRVDELAALSERPRKARAGVRGVQRPQRVSRCRLVHHLRRLFECRGRRGHRPLSSKSCAASSRRRCRMPSCSGRRIISRAA